MAASAAVASSLQRPLLAATPDQTQGAAASSFLSDKTDRGVTVEPQQQDGAASDSATISFWHLRYEVPHRLKKGVKKVLLDDINGIVRPGQVLAIMGPSGCGKTSFLDILGARNSPTGGGLAANGQLYGAHMRQFIGLVPQDEALFPTLTVQESLAISASLRLPAHFSKQAREARVCEVLEELNLTAVKDSLIGDKLKRGVSGGERKRVSIGKELCYQPKLLLLDEPTSGLDSFTSIKVMTLLRRLAESGRTLVCTVHQPSSDLFAKFDQLMLLVSGRVVFYGEAAAALRYFQALGLRCPPHTNPADFFLSLCDESDEPLLPGSPTGLSTPRALVDRLVETYKTSEVRRRTLAAIALELATAQSAAAASAAADEEEEEEEEEALSLTSPRSGGRRRGRWWRLRYRNVAEGEGLSTPLAMEVEEEGKEATAGDGKAKATAAAAAAAAGSRGVAWSTQFWVLCKRSLLHTCRNPLSSYVILGRSIVMALLVGSLYFQLGQSAEDVQNRGGAIYFLLINQVFSALGSLHLLLDEQEIVSHEAKSAMYPVSAYYMAKQVAELPIQLSTSALFAVVVYWLVGFQRDAGRALTFLVAMLLTSLVGESYILVCGSITTSGKVAITIAPVLMALFMLFGGFFVNQGSVPEYYAWIKYISLFNYLNGAIQKNEFEGLVFENGLTGEEVIESLHLMPLTVWQNLAVILGMIGGFRCLAFVFVRRNFTPKPFVLPADVKKDLVAAAAGLEAGSQDGKQQPPPPPLADADGGVKDGGESVV